MMARVLWCIGRMKQLENLDKANEATKTYDSTIPRIVPYLITPYRIKTFVPD